jgi:hypothetical protein
MNMKRKDIAKGMACLSALLAILLPASNASAYVYCGYLDGRFNFRAYHFNSEFWVDMVVAESQKWNRIYPVLSIDRTKSSTVPVGKDGNNIITWLSEASLNKYYNTTWVGSVGLTVTWYDGGTCGRVIEQDMMFNPSVTLFAPQTTVPFQLGFQEIALHELGHAVTLDHEDRSLAVMTTNNAVSNMLHHNDKVGWNRSAAQKFNPLPSPINDMGVFPLRNAPGAKTYSTLSTGLVARGASLTIRDFSVENLSNVFPFSNAAFRIVFENTATGAVVEIGTLTWANFNPFSGWSGNLTFNVPVSAPLANYRVAAILKGTDDDSSNNRAVFGTVTVN